MSGKCSKCNEPFNAVSDKDLIATCCDCSGSFHSRCCTPKVWQAWAKRTAKKEAWKCDSCNVETSSEASSSSAVLSVLNELRKQISDNHKDTKRRFDSLDKTLNTLREVVEESKNRITALEENNEKLREQLELVKSEEAKRCEEMYELRLELLELQQYSRRNNLEIKGIPYSHGENVYAILERIAAVLDVPWNYGGISIAHRLPQPPSGAPSTIIVAFVNRFVKEQWLAAAKAKKLNTTDLSPKLKPGPVYINSHLTRHNKQLLGRARQLVRDRKLANAWAVDGKVMARNMAGTRTVRVMKMEDIDKVASS